MSSAAIVLAPSYEVRVKREEHVTDRDLNPLPRSAELPKDALKGA